LLSYGKISGGKPSRESAPICPAWTLSEIAFREATEKNGCVDILVNNAGVSESTPFTDYTEETFDKVMELNVKGVFNATRGGSGA
jgi:NAD(P)-dependent dehydrogenase (short-subunit alcohol dehydrogenase family)